MPRQPTGKEAMQKPSNAPKAKHLNVPEHISERYHDDWRLVQDCVNGDRARWMELLERHEATVYFAILHTLRTRRGQPSEDEVLDLQADIFTRLVKDNFRKLSQYSGRCKLSHWLKIVASHHTIDHLRHQRPTVSLDDDADSAQAVRRSLTASTVSPEHTIARQQQRDAFWALCDELPKADRDFIELHVRQERSFEEIAEMMDTTVGAVYARKNRVRKKLTTMARERGLV